MDKIIVTTKLVALMISPLLCLLHPMIVEFIDSMKLSPHISYWGLKKEIF